MTSLNVLTETTIHEEASPAIIELGLSLLIRQYLRRRDKTQAHAVVKQLEALLSHSGCIGYPNHRCSYMKMLQQWKAIAMTA